MDNNLSDDDFWNMLEDAEESVNIQTEKSVPSLKEQIDQFSINESKTFEELKMMQARKRKMAAQAITAERKARNHRLFKLGEIVERILGRDITDEDIIKFETFLTEQEQCDKQFSRVMNKDCNYDK
ncbi:hypothetical protein [Holdemanella biformis]|uniref:hypothetical protein n=1 Tax=Holdemanella biformis TaxID=1735 RepID=UPI0022E87A7E|nr:hypothetical protein [Holdemanella biformis]